jgi:hypothetical protein
MAYDNNKGKTSLQVAEEILKAHSIEMIKGENMQAGKINGENGFIVLGTQSDYQTLVEMAHSTWIKG